LRRNGACLEGVHLRLGVRHRSTTRRAELAVPARAQMVLRLRRPQPGAWWITRAARHAAAWPLSQARWALRSPSRIGLAVRTGLCVLSRQVVARTSAWR